MKAAKRVMCWGCTMKASVSGLHGTGMWWKTVSGTMGAQADDEEAF